MQKIWFFLIILSATFCRLTWAQDVSKKPACIESRQALYDLGSGSTKLTVVSLDTCKSGYQVLFKDSRKVDYKEDLLKGSAKVFSKKIQEQGLLALRSLKQKASRFKPAAHKGIATAAFREAGNGNEFSEKIDKELKISVRVITQDEEAHLAYQAVSVLKGDQLNRALVWDVGGGSFQFVSKSEKWTVTKGNLASVGFKEKVNSSVKNIPINRSPNPMTLEEINKARWIVQQELGSDLKNKFKNYDKVYGIGGVLSQSVRRHLAKSKFTVEEIDAWIVANKSKKDTEFNDSFAATVVTNMILISEMMKISGIKEVEAVDVSLVEGLLLETQPKF